MATNRAALTEADIRSLLKGATEDERAAAAQKVCRRLESAVDEVELEAAGEVLRLIAADAVELVRRALVVTLKHSSVIPRDVALRLADDVDQVAAPLLTHSPVFTDDDLVVIAKAAGAAKQIAIARRPALSDKVAGAIVRHGCEDAVRTTCANDNAELSERSLDAAIIRFGHSANVANAIAYRKLLPAAISEKLVVLVADDVRQHLVDHHALSAETALEIALGTRERATIDLVEQAQGAEDMKAFASHLHAEERLTPSLLLRCVAHGNIAFFEWALSQRAGVPHHRTWLMVHDAGPLGLRAIYERADMPERLFPAIRVAVDAFRALQAEGGADDVEHFQERMLQRFLTQPNSAAREDMDYLLERMDRLGRKQRAQARARMTKGAA